MKQKKFVKRSLSALILYHGETQKTQNNVSFFGTILIKKKKQKDLPSFYVIFFAIFHNIILQTIIIINSLLIIHFHLSLVWFFLFVCLYIVHWDIFCSKDTFLSQFYSLTFCVKLLQKKESFSYLRENWIGFPFVWFVYLCGHNKDE